MEKEDKSKEDREDESSEDEDYVPEADIEGQIEDRIDEAEEAKYSQKQAKKQMGTQSGQEMKRKVDDLWDDLNVNHQISQKSTQKSKQLLNKLLCGKSNTVKKQKVREFKIPVLGCSASVKRTTELKKQDTNVTEVLKFAGKEYSVTKKVAPKESALDLALAAINQPKKISTIEKSSMDWDTFKDKEGIVDELQQYTKDGYLEKQDFLNRVDLRKFELEKSEREKQRRANQL